MEPICPNAHFRIRSSAGVVVKSTYGYDILSNNDGYIKLAADALIANASLGTIGLNPIDVLPFCKYKIVDHVFHGR